MQPLNPLTVNLSALPFAPPKPGLVGAAAATIAAKIGHPLSGKPPPKINAATLEAYRLQLEILGRKKEKTVEEALLELVTSPSIEMENGSTLAALSTLLQMGCKAQLSVGQTIFEIGTENNKCALSVHEKKLKKKEGNLLLFSLKQEKFSQGLCQHFLNTLLSLQFFPSKIQLYIEGQVPLTLGCGEDVHTRVHISSSGIQIKKMGIAPSSLGMQRPSFTTYLAKQNPQETLLVVTYQGRIQATYAFSSPLCQQDIHLALPHPEFVSIHTRAFIKILVKEVFEKKVSGAVLLGIYEVLRTLHFSLSHSLRETIMEQLSLAKAIAIPWEHQEQLAPLLSFFPRDTFFVPLPTELAAGHFIRFEETLLECVQLVEKDPLALKGLRKKLIEGKSVLFVEGQLHVQTLGMRGVLIAPRFLLKWARDNQGATATAEETLCFSLVHRFAEEGRSLETSLSQPLKKTADKCFIVTSMGTFPDMREAISVFKNHFLASSRNSSFAAFWNTHFTSWILPLLRRKKNLFSSFVLDELSSFSFAHTKARLFLHQDQLFRFKKTLTENQFRALTVATVSSAIESVPLDELAKLFFFWLFKNYDLFTLDGSSKVFLGERQLWPICNKEMTVTQLKLLFSHLIDDPKKNATVFYTSYYSSQHPFPWEELAPFFDLQNSLQEDIIEVIFPLLAFREALIHEPTLNPTLKEDVKNTVQRLLYHYTLFCTVSYESIHFQYGNNAKRPLFLQENVQGDFAVTLDQLIDICLKCSPAVLKKLLFLLEEEMLQKLNLQKRDHCFAQNRASPLYSILSFNGVAQWCTLMTEMDADVETVAFLVEGVQRPEELFFLSLLPFTTHLAPHFQAEFAHKQGGLLCASLKQAVLPYVREEFNFVDFPFVNTPSFTTSLTELVKGMERLLAYTWLTRVADKSSEAHAERLLRTVPTREMLQQAPSFQRVQLQYVLRTPLFLEALLTRDMNKILAPLQGAPCVHQSRPTSLPRQAPSVTRTLHVALEQTVQRIKARNAQNQKHEICVEFAAFDPSPSILIHDSQGYSSLQDVFNFLTELRFALFDGCTHLTLKTKLEGEPQKILFFHIIPLRQEGVCVDLSIRCIEGIDAPFLGTELTFVPYQPQDASSSQDTLRLKVLAAEEYFIYTFGRSEVTDISFFLVQGKHKKPVFRVGTTANVVEMPCSTVRQISDKSLQKEGWVYKSGLPLMPLKRFLIQEKLLSRDLAEIVNLEWVWNIREMPSLETLHQEFAHWFFYNVMRDNAFKNYFPHFSSSYSDFSQVQPYFQQRDQKLLISRLYAQGDLEAFKRFLEGYEFAKWSFEGGIAVGYRFFVTPLLATGTFAMAHTHFTKWKTDLLGNVNPLAAVFLNELIFPWFEKKIPPPVRAVTLVNPSLEICNTAGVLARAHQNLFILGLEILYLYVEEFAKIVPLKKIDFFFFYENSSALGRCNENGIFLNLFNLHLEDLLQLALKLNDKERLAENSLYSWLIPTLFSSGILNHELEHHRRGEAAHFHEPTKNCQGKFISFEAGASSFVKKAHSLGLFDRLAEKIGRVLVKYHTTNDLKLIISQIRNLPLITYHLFIAVATKNLQESRVVKK